jgi:hypothetical protein
MDDYTNIPIDETDDPAQSEAEVQRQLIAEFNAARKAGDKADAERIARMFLSYPWSKPPGSSGAFAMRMFIERTDAAQREKEGHENICVLRRCLYKKWNYHLALSTLEEIERLRKEGWIVCADDRELIEACRMRCEEHVVSEQKEARWNKLCDDLRQAVHKRDASAIARILSAPEFRSREPEDESLMWRAERIIDRRSHSEMPVKLLPFVAVAALLIAIIGFSVRNSRSKIFNEKCIDEADKLEALLDTFDPIEQISAEISYLQHEDPEVLSDSRIFAFIDKLEKMKADNLVRTNEIASLLVELETIANDNWKDANEGTIDKIERVDELLKPHDAVYAKRLLQVKESAIAYSETKRDNKRKDAEQYVLRLAPILDSVARRLDTELPDEELQSLAQKCEEALLKWRDSFAKSADDLNARLAGPRQHFREAKKKQEDVATVFSRLKSAVRAIDVITLRELLSSSYSSYEPIASLAPLPYSSDDVRGVLNGLAEELYVQDDDKKEPIGIRRAYSAGKIQFDPFGKAYKRNKNSIVPHVANGVSLTAPLYILRRENGELVLRRALIRRDDKWGIVSQAVKDDLILGEPLFQIR